MWLGDKKPSLGRDVFVAPSAAVIGDVQLGNNASVFYGSVIRGERPRQLQVDAGGARRRVLLAAALSPPCCCSCQSCGRSLCCALTDGRTD